MNTFHVLIVALPIAEHDGAQGNVTQTFHISRFVDANSK